jgi:hypothetical protein
MDRQKFEQRCAFKFWVQLGESATVTYEKVTKSLWRTFAIQGTSVQMAQVIFKAREQVEDEPRAERLSTSKMDENVEWQISCKVRSKTDVANDL